MKAVDTGFIIDLLNGDPGAAEKAEEIGDNQIATTTISVFEVAYGIFRSQRTDSGRTLGKAEHLFNRLEILPFDHQAALLAGKITALLDSKGEKIERMDAMIGATVMVNGCECIITRNVKHFSRLEELKTESY